MGQGKKRPWDIRIDYLSSEDWKYLSTVAFEEEGNLSDWQSQLGQADRELKDRRIWNAYLGAEAYGEKMPPNRIGHADLVSRAKNRAPESPGNLVSDYGAWLYSLYTRPPRKSTLESGKRGERAIEREIARFSKPALHSDWTLRYKDPLDDRPPPKQISSLEVSGNSLWGAPDLVFQHRTTGEVAIIERKVSSSSMPQSGWPNLRGQLWAYAHIDEWANAPRIHLVGDVWKPHSPRKPNSPEYVRSAIKHWLHSDQQWLDENEELFNLYGGTILQS